MEIEIEQVRDFEQVWPQVRQLFQELNELHLPLTGQDLLPDWEQRVRAAFEPAMRSGQSVFFVARVGGEVAGFINGHAFENAGIFRERLGFVDNAYVRRDLRGRRVASRLLAALEEWFASKGAEAVELNVVSANEHAVRVWDHLGFKPFSERRRKRLA
jgi:ribosomal protein S18 acetylase RimI-like enzyme